jgi:hypothetical protein
MSTGFSLGEPFFPRRFRRRMDGPPLIFPGINKRANIAENSPE